MTFTSTRFLGGRRIACRNLFPRAEIECCRRVIAPRLRGPGLAFQVASALSSPCDCADSAGGRMRRELFSQTS